MNDFFTKKEVIAFVKENILFQRVGEVRQKTGIHCLDYNIETADCTFLFVDGISHYHPVEVSQIR